MAKVVDKFTGSLSGQLGDMVYRRYKNGSVFVARQKSVNTISYSPKCIKTRNNFKVAVAFAKASNLLPDIHTVWKNSVYEGRSLYTKILKANIGTVNSYMLPGASTKLTPKGFGLNVKFLSLTKDKINFSISLPEFAKSFVNIKFVINCVLALYNPIQSENETDKEPEFICVSDYSEITFPDYDNFHTFEFNLNSMNSLALSKYRNAKIFLALTNTEGSKHIFSGTFHFDSQISE